MPAAAPARPATAASDKRSRAGRNLNVWLPTALVDALDRYVDTSRPRTDKTGATEVALEEFLKSKGFWPPSGN